MNSTFQLVYISRSRLQRNRANLLQTLHMVNAFEAIGLHAQLYLSPWPKTMRLNDRLRDFGIERALDVRSSQLLHSRWKTRPFIWLHQRLLRRADAIYVRAVPVSLLLAQRGLPHVLEIHDTEKLSEAELDAVSVYHREGLIRWLVPISRSAQSVLIDAGAIAERILVAPSGVDLPAFGGLPPFTPPVSRLPHIVYPGSLSRDRGLGIFEDLVEQGVAQVTLLGEQTDPPRQLSGLKVLPFVPHREIPSWYGRADYVLLPYQTHLQHAASISPIKLFEAMAAGRPIIASDLPAIREILTHEDNALLVDPADVQAWLAAVQRLRVDPQLASRLAKAGQALAAHFGWEQRARNIAQACGWLQSG